MSKRPLCIMLVDDNPDDNFFHAREIKKHNPENTVVTKTAAPEALEYLRSQETKVCHPDLIFLDINMPGMNGWEFLEEYNRLDKEAQGRAIIIMLTTSENPDDVAKAKGWSFVSEYRSKPLTNTIMQDVMRKYFADR